MKKTLLLALLAGTAAAPAFAQSQAADFVTATRYDAERRVTGTIAPDPDGPSQPLRFAATRNSYDPAGNLVKVEKGELATWQSEAIAPAAWTGFTVHQAIDSAYDAMGRKLKESLSGRDPSTGLMVLKTVTQTEYDPLGRVECSAVRMNPNTFGSLPASACDPATPHATWGPDRITRNRYDVAGRLERVETGVGTSERRDLALYGYNANGKMTSLTDSRGFRAEMRHDGHDRQVKWVFPSKTVPGRVDETDYEEYGWDPAGNRTSFRNRAGETIGFSYDALNRVTAKDVPEAGGDVAYSYDLRGLQRSALYAATGLGIASAYDKARRQTSTTTNLDGTSRTYAIAYDSNSNRTRLTHPDGPWFDYGHDGLDRMTTLKDNAGATLVTLAYDAAGQRDTATYANGVVTSYDFDPVGRLTSLVHDFGGSATTHDVTFGYAYSPASQIVSRTVSNDLYAYIPASADTGYSVNGLNQYTQIGGGAVVHDAKGNLTSEGGRALSYDSGNRLTGVVAAPQNFGIAYDPQGRLRALTLTGFVAAFDMVGTDIVAARNNGGATTERYVFGPGVDEPMVGYDNAGARYYFHADGHGNIVAQSAAAGSATRTIGYDEYGKPSAFNSRFLHAGKLHLGGVNAYYNNARFYDYNLGRFLQPDPVGYDDQVNLYAYAGNDPVNRYDPSGTDNCQVKQPDGSLTNVPNCKGDPNAPPVTPEQQREVQDVADIVVTATKDKASSDPEDMDLGRLIELSGPIGFGIWGNQIRYVPFKATCEIAGRSVGQFSPSQFAGARVGGHTHGTSEHTGLGPEEGVMAARNSSGIAVQVDESGVRTVDRLSGSYRAISHGNSGWGDTGARGTQSLVDAWNKPARSGSGKVGDKPTQRCQ